MTQNLYRPRNFQLFKLKLKVINKSQSMPLNILTSFVRL